MARVLIADDETLILEAMMDVLESAGHEVRGVGDGEQALFELQTRDYDVVLIDVMMPKMDGYHVSQQIHGLSSPPKIVIVTSRDYEGDQQALRAAGADAFLPKPFANKDLIEVVGNMVKQRQKS